MSHAVVDLVRVPVFADFYCRGAFALAVETPTEGIW
jgi:hypothetical protein